MNRKQHIKALKTEAFNNPLFTSLQYAIDHLSREWVSRKTHRAEMKKQIDRYNLAQQDIANFVEEIDELKADKDMLRSAFDKSLEKIRQLNKECSTKELARFEALREAQRSKRHRIWLSISTIALLITLLISLFTR